MTKWIALFFWALFVSACSSSSCDIRVYLSDDLRMTYGEIPSLEVDVAGVTSVQQQRLQNLDVDAYFSPGNAVRRSLSPATLYFSDTDSAPYSLDDGSPYWEKWEQMGAEFIAVICNLPALSANEFKQGGTDHRVLLINMHDGFLKDSSEHIVLIGAGGVIKVKEDPKTSLPLREVAPGN